MSDREMEGNLQAPLSALRAAGRLRAERDLYREALEEVRDYWETSPGVGPKDCLDKVTEIARAALATQPTTEAKEAG